jgi:hypothetical protein
LKLILALHDLSVNIGAKMGERAIERVKRLNTRADITNKISHTQLTGGNPDREFRD